MLAEIDSEVAREAYMKRISAETDITVEAIRAEVLKLVYYRNKKQVNKELLKERTPERLTQDRADLSHGQSTATYKTERTLLNLIFYHRRAFEFAKEKVQAEWFSGELHRQLFSQIMAFRAENDDPHAAEFLTGLSEETVKQAATSLLYINFEGDSLQGIKEAASKLETEYLRKQAVKLAGEGKVKEANEIYRRLNERRG